MGSTGRGSTPPTSQQHRLVVAGAGQCAPVRRERQPRLLGRCGRSAAPPGVDSYAAHQFPQAAALPASGRELSPAWATMAATRSSSSSRGQSWVCRRPRWRQYPHASLLGHGCSPVSPPVPERAHGRVVVLLAAHAGPRHGAVAVADDQLPARGIRARTQDRHRRREGHRAASMTGVVVDVLVLGDDGALAAALQAVIMETAAAAATSAPSRPGARLTAGPPHRHPYDDGRPRRRVDAALRRTRSSSPVAADARCPGQRPPRPRTGVPHRTVTSSRVIKSPFWSSLTLGHDVLRTIAEHDPHRAATAS